MSEPESPLDDRQLQAVIERGRTIRKSTEALRARVLARARVTVIGLSDAAGPVGPLRSSPGWHRFRLALAAGVVLALASAGATAAFHAWSSDGPVPFALPTQETPEVRPATIRAPMNATPAAQPPSVLVPKAQRGARPASATESYAAELRLLQRARSEYAAHDFSAALGLVAEHGRRFPNGRLTEEREALRVRTLAAAGRRDEARLAFAAFARRFPRSVLLSRLEQAASVGSDDGR